MIVTTYQYIDLYQKVFSEKCTRYFLFFNGREMGLELPPRFVRSPL